jgi:hypothetical protein
MDLAALGQGGESLTDRGLAPPLLGEGLRARDVGKLPIAVLARNGRRILGVRKPVKMREPTSRPLAGLRDEGNLADLRQSDRAVVMRPDSVDLMKRDQHICASQRRSTQVVPVVRG